MLSYVRFNHYNNGINGTMTLVLIITHYVYSESCCKVQTETCYVSHTILFKTSPVCLLSSVAAAISTGYYVSLYLSLSLSISLSLSPTVIVYLFVLFILGFQTAQKRITLSIVSSYTVYHIIFIFVIPVVFCQRLYYLHLHSLVCLFGQWYPLLTIMTSVQVS